mmetsp:Transcript_118286/g.368385  ORF Transcript_118286/g.368385 Transcript_118286/m.368385 type:complete len:80 (-) Transcript_118286:2-241(-)
MSGGVPQDALPGDGCYPCSQQFGQAMPSIPEEISCVEEEISLVEEEGFPADAGGGGGRPPDASPGAGSRQCDPAIDASA